MWNAIAGALAVVLLAPTVLALLYKVIHPISTPMLGQWLSGGSVVREWRDLEAMSPDLPVAVLLSEDGQFCRHRGVDWGELRALLREEGGPTRGGSTLAMQTARNLFLWRGASYLRKALEIPLALMLDRILGKRRLMEIYLNIAEWGEGGVFGAQAGAQRQFGVDVADLGRAQAARMAAILPNPIVFRAASGQRTARVAGIIERRMRGAGPWTECLDR